MSSDLHSANVTSIGSLGVRALPSRMGSVVRLAPRFAATHGTAVSGGGRQRIVSAFVVIPVASDTGVQPRGVPV